MALLACACRSGTSEPIRPTPSAVKSAPPVDRLAPDELAPGTAEVFGFEVPRGLTLRGRFADVAYLDGNVPPEALANYVRDRVVVEHVELGVARTIFPRARVKNGPADRIYQFDVIAVGRRSELTIRDVTPRPGPAEELSDEERWRRAGRRPDGKPFDITELR